MSGGIPKADLGVLLCMLYVALTDGHLAPEEVASLEAQVHDLGLEVDVRRMILEALRYPPTPVDLARRVPDPERRIQALEAAAAAALADGALVEAEQRALERLAMAFDVPKAALGAIQEKARAWVAAHGLAERFAASLGRRLSDYVTD